MADEIAVKLDREELHLLVTWGYAIRERDIEGFKDFGMQDLLDKLRALRGEWIGLGLDDDTPPSVDERAEP